MSLEIESIEFQAGTTQGYWLATLSMVQVTGFFKKKTERFKVKAYTTTLDPNWRWIDSKEQFGVCDGIPVSTCTSHQDHWISEALSEAIHAHLARQHFKTLAEATADLPYHCHHHLKETNQTRRTGPIDSPTP